MLMMIPNEGKERWLAIALGQIPFDDLEVQLYQNNYTPVATTTAADFTPATFTGAGVWTIDEGDWGPPAIISNEAVAVVTPAPQWTHGGGAAQLVYGWFAVDATDGRVLMAQRFDAARNMTTGSIEALDPFQLKLKTYA